jgi:malate dehydrogenase
MGVPCILSEKGIESVVELDLNPRERADFDHSVAAVRDDVGRLKEIR